MTTTTRPTPGRAFLCPPGRPAWAAMSLYSPAASRRLCAILRPAGGYFAPMSSRAGAGPKKQDRRKGHLQARHGVLCSYGYPYIPTPSNGPQRPADGQTGHKSTPARSIRSKPGLYHLFRAMDSTAQRSLSASHQAQNWPTHSICFNTNSLLAKTSFRPVSISAILIGHSFPS